MVRIISAYYATFIQHLMTHTVTSQRFVKSSEVSGEVLKVGTVMRYRAGGWTLLLQCLTTTSLLARAPASWRHWLRRTCTVNLGSRRPPHSLCWSVLLLSSFCGTSTWITVRQKHKRCSLLLIVGRLLWCCFINRMLHNIYYVISYSTISLLSSFSDTVVYLYLLLLYTI